MSKLDWKFMAEKATKIWKIKGLLPKQSPNYHMDNYCEPGRIYDRIGWIGTTIDFDSAADTDKDSNFYICNDKWIDIKLDTKHVLAEIYNASTEQEKEEMLKYFEYLEGY